MVDEINEKSLSGAQRYYMHAQAHDQAAQKYGISSKSASPEQAKIHRKLGRFHKTISAALSQIAGVHTSNDFNRAMKKKAENMANKKMNESDDAESIHKVLHTHWLKNNVKWTPHIIKGPQGTKHVQVTHSDGSVSSVDTHNDAKRIIKEDVEMEDLEFEDDVYEDAEPTDREEGYLMTEHIDMMNAIYDNEPGAFSAAFASLMQRKALERVEEIKVDLAQSTFNSDVQEDVEELDEMAFRKSPSLGNSQTKEQEALGRRLNSRLKNHSVNVHHHEKGGIEITAHHGGRLHPDVSANLQKNGIPHRYENQRRRIYILSGDAHEHGKKYVKEDVDQIDEISKNLARRYAAKSAEELSSINTRSIHIGNSKNPDQKKLDKLERKFNKRYQGLDRANKRTGGVKYTPKF